MSWKKFKDINCLEISQLNAADLSVLRNPYLWICVMYPRDL